MPFMISAQPPALKVLFIGNSFMWNNNLPQIEKDMVAQTGINAEIESHLVLGQSIDHFIKDGACWALIKSRAWDYIVIQDYQGYYYDYYGKIDSNGLAIPLVKNNLIFQDSIKKLIPCVKIVYFAGWEQKGGIASRFPGDNSIKLISRIMANYTYLNNMPGVHNTIAPIGAAWIRCINERPDIELFGSDNRHPGYAGSYLTACVLFSTIFHAIPADSNIPIDLKIKKQDLYLKTIASKVIADSFEYTNLASILPGISAKGRVFSAPAGYASYQWYGDSKMIKGANSSKCTAGDNTTCYWVMVTNKHGCTFRSLPLQVYEQGGITDIPFSNNVRIFPGTTTGMIHIKFGESAVWKNARISLTNALGSEIFSKDISTTATDYKLDLKQEGVRMGFYTIKIHMASSTLISKVFVI
jgi:hypothetical protein